jgi:predicted RNA polymerase sigma factor
LLALMLHAEARRRARRNEGGEYVALAKQDITLWDATMIAQAEALLVRASKFAVVGRFQLEAAVQSAHVARCRTGTANWEQVVEIYDALLAITGSPVVAINRALAIAEVHGTQAGLEAMPDSSADARLAEYQPYWAARAELLARAGVREKACHAYDVAIGLERDPAIRSFLKERRAVVTGSRD